MEDDIKQVEDAYILPGEFLSNLLGYLKTKPYQEVEFYVQNIQASHKVSKVVFAKPDTEHKEEVSGDSES